MTQRYPSLDVENVGQATDGAAFATSEVRFGIIPAVISPYVLRAIGPRQALRYFQSAERGCSDASPGD